MIYIVGSLKVIVYTYEINTYMFILHSNEDKVIYEVWNGMGYHAMFMQIKVHTNILYLSYGYWLEYNAQVETNI